MADVLSQSQIDALLNSMQNTEVKESRFQEPQPEEKYRKYDFYSPKKYDYLDTTSFQISLTSSTHSI